MCTHTHERAHKFGYLLFNILCKVFIYANRKNVFFFVHSLLIEINSDGFLEIHLNTKILFSRFQKPNIRHKNRKRQ